MKKSLTSTIRQPFADNGDNPVASMPEASPADCNPFTPEKMRLDQSDLDLPAVKPATLAISIRKPAPLEFVRVRPGEEWRLSPICFIELKGNREYYYVPPKLKPELRPREYWIGSLFLATNRLEKPFFWLVKLQSPTGRVSDWYTTELDCVENAERDWIQVVSDNAAGGYTTAFADERLEEPVWPEQSFAELLRLAFKRRTVDSLEHPVFKQLRGKK